MIAIIICVISLLASFLAGRASLIRGLIAVLATGYFYGIIRANVISPYSHFIFDASLIGLYLSQLSVKNTADQAARSSHLKLWIVVLVGWPVLVCFMPFQTPLISLVGLRGNVFFLPLCLLAVRLRGPDWRKLAYALAVLNGIALAFGVAEYFLGIERFYPPSAVTSIIYMSKDVAGAQFFRIPGTFTSAHAYAGTMLVTLPLLIGLWTEASLGAIQRCLLIAGVGAAGVGILMANARSHVVAAAIVAASALVQGRMSIQKRLVWCLVVAGAVFFAVSNERFQRIATIVDTDGVESRIHGSVNRTFFEILIEYPMGNGLGGGGTSIPSFLEGQVRKPVGMENEYARVLLEQGIIGLLIWIGFIGRFFISRFSSADGEYAGTRKLMWLCCAVLLGTGLIGTGMLTSIPQTALLMLGMGWVMVRPAESSPRESATMIRTPVAIAG